MRASTYLPGAGLLTPCTTMITTRRISTTRGLSVRPGRSGRPPPHLRTGALGDVHLTRRGGADRASVADAALLVLAEAESGRVVVTTDREDFGVYRIHRRRVVPALMPPV